MASANAGYQPPPVTDDRLLSLLADLDDDAAANALARATKALDARRAMKQQAQKQSQQPEQQVPDTGGKLEKTRLCNFGDCNGENCNCVAESGVGISVASATAALPDVHLIPSGPEAQEAAEALVRAVSDGNWDEAGKLWMKADLGHLSESGWTNLHWIVHAATGSAENSALAASADDNGATLKDDLLDSQEANPNGCSCCQPIPPCKDARAFLQQLLLKLSGAIVVDAQSTDGATGLMFAADAGDEEMCGWFLSAGADPAAVDCDGDTAADWAKQKKHMVLAERLRSKNPQDSAGT